MLDLPAVAVKKRKINLQIIYVTNSIKSAVYAC